MDIEGLVQFLFHYPSFTTSARNHVFSAFQASVKKRKKRERGSVENEEGDTCERPGGWKGIPGAGALVRRHHYSNSPSIRFVKMEAKSEGRSLVERITEEIINHIHVMGHPPCLPPHQGLTLLS